MNRAALIELGLFVASLGAFALGALAPHSRSGYEPGARPAGALRVATWNVGGVRDGGRALLDHDLEHVVAVLRELDGDLVLLQELASAAQVTRLRDALGPDWSTRSAAPLNGEHLVAVARRGRLRRLRLDVQGRFLALVFRSETGLELNVVGLHADAFSAAARNEMIGGLCDALLAEGDGRAALLAGDLNLDLDLDKRRDLFSDDAYLDVETYNYVAARLSDAALGTGSTAEPDRRLDYVFVDSARLDVVAAGVWKDRRAGDMDHDPLVVDLRAVD